MCFASNPMVLTLETVPLSLSKTPVFSDRTEVPVFSDRAEVERKAIYIRHIINQHDWLKYINVFWRGMFTDKLKHAPQVYIPNNYPHTPTGGYPVAHQSS